MEELHHGLPQRHLLGVGGRPAVAPLDRPRTGLFTPLQPPDVRHTPGERHGAIIDGIQQGDPFWLPRYLRGHGSRRGEAPRLRKPRARSNPRARKRAARAVEPARPERAAAGPGAWEFPRTAPMCGAPQLDLVRLPPKPITKRWLVLRSADSVRVRENPNSQAAHRRAAGVLHKQHALRNLPCTLGT